VFWGILQRSIFWELAKAFLMSLLALTSILLLAGIIAEASLRGLSPTQIMMAVPLIIPSTLPYTIPSTTLFAICVVYGRLAHDNEITAIKAAGIHVLKVVWPSILLGLLTSAGTLVLYMEVIPQTQYMLRATFLKDVEELFYAMLKNERTINHPKLNYSIWVRQLQGRRLLDVTFKRRDAKGEFDVVVFAREAELLFDYPNNKVLVRMRHGEVFNLPSNSHAFFENQDWEESMPDSPLGMDQSKPKPREMTWSQLLEHKVTLKDKLAENHDKITAQRLKRSGPGPGESRAEIDAMTRQYFNERAATENELRNTNNELHMRPTIALGCLCFALVGCPVGIWFSKRDYLSSFITCFLPVVLVYYPLLLTGHSLVRAGRLPPAPGLWLCDIVAGLIGFFLLRRLLRN
jgi:lipopolysaccharide export system permease protein